MRHYCSRHGDGAWDCMDHLAYSARLQAGSPLAPWREMLALLERWLVKRSGKCLALQVAEKRRRIRHDCRDLAFEARGIAALADVIHDEFHAVLQRSALRNSQSDEVFGVHGRCS